MAKRNSASPAKSPSNPLLTQDYLPYRALPFGQVTVEQIEEALLEGMKQATAEIDAIVNNSEEPSFENTIEALEFSGETLERAGSLFGTLLSTQKTPELSALEKKMQPLFSAHDAKITMNEKLFARIKAVYDQRDQLGLADDQKALLEKSYRSFTAQGANLPKDKKERLQEINLRLSQLSTNYLDNITASTAQWSLLITDENELDGVPGRVKEQLKYAAQQAGHPEGTFLVRLSPSPAAILSYGTNRSLREKIYHASTRVAMDGAHDNRPLIVEIVKLRHEKAQIMGYSTYAAMILSDRMALTAETVEDFLAKNLAVYKGAADKEAQAIRDLASADGITDFKPSDAAFYTRKMQEKNYSLDMETLRPYFELDKVLEGMFKHAEKLFNISIIKTEDKYPVYDPSMQVYEVHDKKDGSLLSVFYTDYFARPGLKRAGAWMNAFQNVGLDKNGKMKVPHIFNACNFDPALPGKPVFLSLNDVNTLFHEFGHALHGITGVGRYGSQNGARVKWDFVELQSQLQENWVLEKEVLDSFAIHNETGKKMPASLIKKVRAVNNFAAASMGRRQTFLGMLDMAWHNNDPANLQDVNKVEEKVAKLAGTFNAAATGLVSTVFSHIFAGGYAAGYYSYKWAEVLEADIFETKFKGDLYNRKNADELREKIYAPGGTRPPMDLFVDYMGRKPDPGALFRREGLSPAKAANENSSQVRKRSQKTPGGPAPA